MSDQSGDARTDSDSTAALGWFQDPPVPRMSGQSSSDLSSDPTPPTSARLPRDGTRNVGDAR